MPGLPTAPARRRGARRSPHPLLAGATVLAIATASATLGSGVANAQTPQPEPTGPIYVNPATGNQFQLFELTSTGGCTVGTPDAYNSVVLGPAPFQPTLDQPDGILFSATENFNLGPGPISTRQRINLVDLAEEAGGSLQAGQYVVTFRCVDGLFGTIFQTYRSTLTIAAAGAGTFTVTAAANPAPPIPGTPVPPGEPTPTPVGATPTPVPSGSATPLPSGSATPSPSGSATPTPTGGTPTPSATAPSAATPIPQPDSSLLPAASGATPAPSASGGALAYTGGPIGLIVGAGLVLTSAGAGLLYRNRSRQGRP